MPVWGGICDVESGGVPVAVAVPPDTVGPEGVSGYVTVAVSTVNEGSAVFVGFSVAELVVVTVVATVAVVVSSGLTVLVICTVREMVCATDIETVRVGLRHAVPLQ